MTLPEWAYWWLTCESGEAGGYACFYPDDVNKSHNLIKLFNGLKENHSSDFISKDDKIYFIGSVKNKKPYLKFVMSKENNKKPYELSLTEDETIKPIEMKDFC